MNLKDPVFLNATGVSAALILFKSFLELGQAMGWWNLDAKQTQVLSKFIEVAIPILVVVVGSLLLRLNVTSLVRPTDLDGVALSRPNDVPAIKEMEAIHSEANELNKGRENP